jgi:hypothetical protein
MPDETSTPNVSAILARQTVKYPGPHPKSTIKSSGPISSIRDVIAWLMAPNSDSDDRGHVMIVRTNPLIDANRPNEILVEVIDSAGTPHAFDSRATGQTGLGTGTISLTTNSMGEAVGFRWRDGESKAVVYTKIAFGQLGSDQTFAPSTVSFSTSLYSSADTGTAQPVRRAIDWGECSAAPDSILYPPRIRCSYPSADQEEETPLIFDL